MPSERNSSAFSFRQGKVYKFGTLEFEIVACTPFLISGLAKFDYEEKWEKFEVCCMKDLDRGTFKKRILKGYLNFKKVL